MNYNDQVLYAVLEDIKKSLSSTVELIRMLSAEQESEKRNEALTLAYRAHKHNQEAIAHFCPPGGL